MSVAESQGRSGTINPIRVCHITTVHSAHDARIFHRMCRGLAKEGLSLVLVAPSADFADPLVRMSPRNRQLAAAGRFRRIVLALRAALAENVDIYHFHDPELITVGLALKVLRPSRAVVYDVHEDYPAMMLEKYWLPTRSRRSVGQAIRVANAAAGLGFDGIVTADPGVARDFETVAGKRTIVYYNFPTLALFTAGAGAQPVKKADLVYIGGLSERSGTFVVLDALASLAAQGIRPSLRLAGYTDGEAGRSALLEGIERRGLSAQVEFDGRIPHSAVPDWIRSGRIGLVPFRPITKFMKNIPSKLFEYWACGLPVIASDLPPIRPFLTHNKNGLSVRPSSVDDLAGAVRFLLEQPEEIEAMGRCGQRLVQEELNNEMQVSGLIRFYEQIVRR